MGPEVKHQRPQGLKNPDVWVHLAFLVRLGHFFDISPIKALYWTAILNGLLAPFLLVGILIIACDRTIMQKQLQLVKPMSPLFLSWGTSPDSRRAIPGL